MKTLVAYFSASGVTAKRAAELAKAAGADLYEIKPAEPYTAQDLDWTNKQSRSSLEMADESSRPALGGDQVDVAAYDRVYVGFPIWWGVAPRVVDTFLDENDLSGKKVFVFATSGGSGIEHAVDEMKARYPKLDIVGGKLLKGPVSSDVFQG